MSNDLIWQPDVFAIGQTQFNGAEFSSWLDMNGFGQKTHVLHTDFEDSPLSRLWADVSEEDSLERMIEFGGRHCYRAWDKGRDRMSYIKNIIDMQHGSVLEHSTINWAIQGVSRSLSLELARHRVGIALSQESQRYVDAADINFVVPPLLQFVVGGSMSEAREINDFYWQNMAALGLYKALQQMLVGEIGANSSNVKSLTSIKKRANEAARAHLPNCCETRFLWTTNMRFLRHFLWLRGGSGADLEIRRLAICLLEAAQQLAPSVFADMTTVQVDEGYGVPVIVKV